MFVNARSQPCLRDAMPAGNATNTGSAEGTRGGRRAWLPGMPGSQGGLPPDALGPAPSPAECQGLCAHCLLCKHCWLPIPVLHLTECKAGARGDLCNELNQNVPFSLHTPHQSLLNNNNTRKFLYMLNPNPNNSRRLQNSSLTHRWEIPGRLSSSIKQMDKIETLIEFLLNYFCF